MTLFLSQDLTCYKFKHAICFPCSVVNKTYYYESCKTSNSVFMYVFHTFPTFEGNWSCIYCTRLKKNILDEKSLIEDGGAENWEQHSEHPEYMIKTRLSK